MAPGTQVLICSFALVKQVNWLTWPPGVRISLRSSSLIKSSGVSICTFVLKACTLVLVSKWLCTSALVPDEEAAGLLVADGAETLLPQRLVQTCTFVPVKQVNRVPYIYMH